MKAVGETLAYNAFAHGFLTNNAETQGTVKSYLKFSCYPVRSDQPKFKGIIIDTAANRHSIMNESQYHAYQEEFDRRVPMRPPKRDVKGIGGIRGRLENRRSKSRSRTTTSSSMLTFIYSMPRPLPYYVTKTSWKMAWKLVYRENICT